ncbi:MAG TPA: hypothetical protein VGY97_05820 [Solirubrobacteraceae bacterium]|jgi:hypothetical protein|nr:hypothetical protein [Solirubrobacteraceae bacterium]
MPEDDGLVDRAWPGKPRVPGKIPTTLRSMAFIVSLLLYLHGDHSDS